VKLFYWRYQKLTNRAEAVGQVATVPTDAQRLGNFTGLATQLRNPTDGLTGQPLRDASGNLCITAGSNVINPNCISPVANAYLAEFIPQSATGSVVKLIPSPLDAYNFVTRVDYTVSARNNLFGHFFYDNYERIASSATWTTSPRATWPTPRTTASPTRTRSARRS
jgi:hypothetical protein